MMDKRIVPDNEYYDSDDEEARRLPRGSEDASKIDNSANGDEEDAMEEKEDKLEDMEVDGWENNDEAEEEDNEEQGELEED
jgi:hypothetical protein